MAKQQLVFEQHFNAPMARVFAYFADHGKFGQLWPGHTRRITAAADANDPNGQGSVRRIKAGLLPTFDETIVLYQPCTRIEYSVTRGSPIKNHRGVLCFSEVGAGTLLHYRIGFDAKIPFTGGLIRRLLARQLRAGVARQLAAIEAGA